MNKPSNQSMIVFLGCENVGYHTCF